MSRRIPLFGAALAVLLIVSASAARPAAQQAPAPEKKIWDGVYTSAQAARGKEPFERSCARCHNVELAGSQRGPALKGTAFWSKYDNEGLSSLFMFIRDTMPQDGPSLLTDEIKVDVLAYIMSANGMPAGNAELKADLRALDDIKIARKTTFDGVFTEAQAERGKQNFLTGRCGGCHKLDLTGDRGPTLKGDDFLAHWDNGSVATLFDKIRETMPPNAPNESTDDAKIDIVAYLLQQNNFPAGKTELRADADVARHHRSGAEGQTTTTIPELLARAGGGMSDAGAEQGVDAHEHERTGADARRRTDRGGAPDLAGQGARRSDLSAGQRRAVQAGRARGSQDGSPRPPVQGPGRRPPQPDVAADARPRVRN